MSTVSTYTPTISLVQSKRIKLTTHTYFSLVYVMEHWSHIIIRDAQRMAPGRGIEISHLLCFWLYCVTCYALSLLLATPHTSISNTSNIGSILFWDPPNPPPSPHQTSFLLFTTLTYISSPKPDLPFRVCLGLIGSGFDEHLNLGLETNRSFFC